VARRTNLVLVIVAVSGLFALCEPMWSSERVEGLIAHWKFDEGSGKTAYDSAGDNHGTIHGANWTTGQISGGLRFDGVDDYVDVGDPVDGSLDFGATDSFSISVWVKIAQDGQPVYKQRCAGVGGVYHEGYKVRVYLEKLYFGFKDTGDNGISIYGNTIVTDDQWHHVVAVRDTGTDKLYLYLDGTSDATPVTDITIGSLDTDRSLEIARADSTVPPGVSYYGGKIDDVRIYDRALSAEEIRQLYRKGGSGNSTPVHTMSAINNIGRAIREKVEEWMKIDDTLRKEWEAYKTLDETLRSGDYGDLSYGDIVTARQEIYASIGHGQQSKEALEKSIENLEAALAALGFELVPKASAWLEQAKRAMP